MVPSTLTLPGKPGQTLPQNAAGQNQEPPPIYRETCTSLAAFVEKSCLKQLLLLVITPRRNP